MLGGAGLLPARERLACAAGVSQDDVPRSCCSLDMLSQSVLAKREGRSYLRSASKSIFYRQRGSAESEEQPRELEIFTRSSRVLKQLNRKGDCREETDAPEDRP